MVYHISKELRNQLLKVSIKLDGQPWTVNSALGWRRYHSTYRPINAWYNKRLGIVIKRPANILDTRTPEFLRAPTTDLVFGWRAQPILKKVKLARARDAILCKVNRWNRRHHEHVTPDLHTGNVGWYKGKPLLFDW